MGGCLGKKEKDPKNKSGESTYSKNKDSRSGAVGRQTKLEQVARQLPESERSAVSEKAANKGMPLSEKVIQHTQPTVSELSTQDRTASLLQKRSAAVGGGMTITEDKLTQRSLNKQQESQKDRSNEGEDEKKSEKKKEDEPRKNAGSDSDSTLYGIGHRFADDPRTTSYDGSFDSDEQSLDMTTETAKTQFMSELEELEDSKEDVHSKSDSSDEDERQQSELPCTNYDLKSVRPLPTPLHAVCLHCERCLRWRANQLSSQPNRARRRLNVVQNANGLEVQASQGATSPFLSPQMRKQPTILTTPTPSRPQRNRQPVDRLNIRSTRGKSYF